MIWGNPIIGASIWGSYHNNTALRDSHYLTNHQWNMTMPFTQVNYFFLGGEHLKAYSNL